MWLYVLGVLVFVLGLLASIALHEIGHLTFAKAFGVKVTQYMVGFGPTLWSRKRGETEYGVKWIPLGGYIRMIGMVPPGRDGRRSRWPRRLALAVEDFRAASRAEVVDPADEPRQFYRLPPGRKMLVMLGGPVMNFVIFLVLTTGLLLTIGTQVQPPATTTVAAVSQCIVPADLASRATGTDPCPAGATPAPVAGKLRAGDVITAVDGRAVSSFDQVRAVITTSGGRPVELTVTRDGAPVTVSFTPVATTQAVTAADGTTTVRPTALGGFTATQPPAYFQRQSVGQVPGRIADQVGAGLSALGQFPGKISSLVGTVFEGHPRDPAGAVGVVGLGRIGGEVASSHAIDVEGKVAVLVSLLAGLNLLLFFFNLLPLLPLDGGHVAGALVEAARRGWGRVRGRPWVGHVDIAQMVPVMYGVASLLFVFTLLVVYADVVKPIRLTG